MYRAYRPLFTTKYSGFTYKWFFFLNHRITTQKTIKRDYLNSHVMLNNTKNLFKKQINECVCDVAPFLHLLSLCDRAFQEHCRIVQPPPSKFQKKSWWNLNEEWWILIKIHIITVISSTSIRTHTSWSEHFDELFYVLFRKKWIHDSMTEESGSTARLGWESL